MGYSAAIIMTCDSKGCKTKQTIELDLVKNFPAVLVHRHGWAIVWKDNRQVLLCPKCIAKEEAQQTVAECITLSTKSPVFYVICWNTGNILKEFTSLSRAKRYCRDMGFDPTNDPFLAGFMPYAYVGNAKKEVIYNPRFAKPED